MYLRLNNLIRLWLLLLPFSCSNKDHDVQLPIPVLPNQPEPYSLHIPMGFPAPFISRQNPLTKEGVALGERLYSDPILSSNGRSCSSCHNKSLSYSVPLFVKSNGFRVSVPPHVNLAFKSYYNWTGSETNLDTLCIGDFEPEFFNTNPVELFHRLSLHPDYPNMFEKAFGIKDLTALSYQELKVKIAYSVSQYMRTLISANSRYDRYRMGITKLTPDEHAGMYIFFTEKGDCFHCHAPSLFTDNDFHNNGLNSTFSGFNKGRALVTNMPKDEGRFLTPTLRNVALTAPYMHDGRFQTLEEVVEFYNSGVQNSNTIDPIMNKRKNLHSLELSLLEKKQLVDFLNTLTDDEFVK